MSPRSGGDNSDRSDDEYGDGPSGNGTTQNSKRSQRACDRCRKSKSKCEPALSGGARCRGCLAAGTECTFSGPTFRRGPPKGYIQALEHRLHQMESTLAAIMSSKDMRAKGVISDLRRDDLAQSILNGVDLGPFGPTGRIKRSVDPTQDNFFASIVSAAPPKQTSDRSRRQSRMTRESVTQKNPSVLVRPTLEWQDRLSESLARWSLQDREADGAQVTQSLSQSANGSAPSTSDTPRETVRQKRRLDVPSSAPDLDWNELHDIADQDEVDDTADALGNLSIDENKEVRYHDNTCGLHLFLKDEKGHSRNLGGIWQFPMSHLWPGISRINPAYDQRQPATILPPQEKQDHLIKLYFTYVNPTFPVVDEVSFMEQYEVFRISNHSELNQAGVEVLSQPNRPERMQKLSMLLLFSMFAFAAHYSEQEKRMAPHGQQADIGARYAATARNILDTIYQESRTSTCQALILLGVREFGIGSPEAGWLHIGMALRMAFDLGLNRNSEKWRQNGRELFTPAEIQIRRRIWWACCLADKYSAHFLGRPMGIHEADFSTLLPDVPDNDADQTWTPTDDALVVRHSSSTPANFIAYFRETASLTVIHGEVVDKMYPVSRVHSSKRVIMEELHARLIQWSLNLPEALQYSPGSTRSCPPPHVLVMHCYYWATMLLLHRPFMPKNPHQQNSPGITTNDGDIVPRKSYDICRGAASHICTFATMYRQNFDLKYGHPFLTTSLQSAGIMHVITLKHYPQDQQAITGLRECFAACESMKESWPAAVRVRDLLLGTGVRLDPEQAPSPGRPLKRSAQLALDEDDVSPLPERPDFHRAEPQQISIGMQMAEPQPSGSSTTSFPMQGAGHELQGSLLVDLLGSNAPDFTSAMGMSSAYDWWVPMPPPEYPPLPHSLETYHESYLMMPSQSFTFDQHQLSPEFIQGIRDPVLHFPSTNNIP